LEICRRSTSIHVECLHLSAEPTREPEDTVLPPRKSDYKNRIELDQGTLDMLILQTLQWGPQHGYGIVQALHTHSVEVLQVEPGSLDPAPIRRERQGWVRSQWKQTGDVPSPGAPGGEARDKGSRSQPGGLRRSGCAGPGRCRSRAAVPIGGFA